MNRQLSNPHTDEFKAIYEACEEGIIAVEKNGLIILANPSAHSIFGYAPGELVGKTVECLIPPQLSSSHVGYRQGYNKHPIPRRMGKGRDLRGVRKDESEFPVEISLTSATINGRTNTIAFIIDISERKKYETALKNSEEQLLQYASELEKRVADRTLALQKTNAALKQQIRVTKKAEKEALSALEREQELSELKSRFVAMASHEFRTPLSTILSSASLLDKYLLQPQALDKQKKHVTKIKQAIKGLNDILNDFLSLSKLEEGKVSLRIQALDLEEIIQKISEEFTPLLKEGQQIKLLILGHKYTVETDPHLIRNSLVNLLSNAIKYSDHEIKVVLSFEEPEIVAISIIDKGLGIPASEQKFLFDRFFRAKNVTHIQGTGLGLNIVKKYVTLLNGTISFTSVAGQGTEFQLKLPANFS